MSTVLLISGNWDTASPEAGPSLRGALERVGFDVIEVATAACALATCAFARVWDRPDLIVVSRAVPDMDLLDLCTALRKDPVAEKVPFVLVADAAAESGGAATRSGADLVFPASVRAAEVADRLRQIF